VCIVRELITKYKSLDVDFWNGKTSCMLIESREMWKDQGEVGRRSVNGRFAHLSIEACQEEAVLASEIRIEAEKALEYEWTDATCSYSRARISEACTPFESNFAAISRSSAVA
jgi:hypothetical protein